MVVVDYDGIIDRDDLPEEIGGELTLPKDTNRTMITDVREPMTMPGTLRELIGKTMTEIEMLVITETLNSVQGNREETAKILDIGERTLYRKIKEYGITAGE
jgi:two-component system response regulator HydG